MPGSAADGFLSCWDDVDNRVSMSARRAARGLCEQENKIAAEGTVLTRLGNTFTLQVVLRDSEVGNVVCVTDFSAIHPAVAQHAAEVIQPGVGLRVMGYVTSSGIRVTNLRLIPALDAHRKPRLPLPPPRAGAVPLRPMTRAEARLLERIIASDMRTPLTDAFIDAVRRERAS